MSDLIASAPREFRKLSGDTPALRRRRRAETRLKAYGIVAILLAALALIVLLSSVVIKAGRALTESYITLPVVLPAEEIDPDATGDPKVIYRANFNGIARDAFRERFSSVSGRSARRELNDLISVGASFELARSVADFPELIGQTIDFRFLTSDIVDLYLKGDYGALNPVATEGLLTASIDEDEAELSTDNNAFSRILDALKAQLVGEAQRLHRQAARQDAGAAEFARRAEAAETDEARAAAQAEAKKRAAERDRLTAEAEALLARAEAQGGTEELDEDNPSALIRAGGGWFKLTEVSPDSATAEILLPPETAADSYADWTLYLTGLPESARKISDRQIAWIEDLQEAGAIDTVFNWRFFSAGDSRDPELAGIWGAAVGSFWTMLVTFALAFPVGVFTAIYLEEFARKTKFTEFVEVNINNLAAVPSIIFGLLGLAVFLNFFGVPRSSPLAGGLVLALMTLPTIIIAARVSMAAVPPSIREAALGVGASEVQTAFHHVLPLALPGILTGTIIGMARALGETAPLITIGMVAFIVDIPTGITDSATVLPVQVYRWSDFPERAFEARTAAAICTLLLFLVLMNALAVLLRRRFERRW